MCPSALDVTSSPLVVQALQLPPPAPPFTLFLNASRHSSCGSQDMSAHDYPWALPVVTSGNLFITLRASG